MSNEENDLYEPLIQPSPQTLQAPQTSRAPQTSEEVFEKKAKEFCEKQTELDKATLKYYFYINIYFNYQQLCSNYEKLRKLHDFDNMHTKYKFDDSEDMYQERVDALNEVYQEHVKALYKAFEEHEKKGKVSEKDEQLIQEFEEAYYNSLKSARMLRASEVVQRSSMAIAIFNNEKPEKGIKILKLCTKFLKAHNEYEIACLERQKIRKQARQQQASQSNNTTLSDSHAAQLARNRASSNSNSNENSR